MKDARGVDDVPTPAVHLRRHPSQALPGTHLCKEHQGNHSHYAQKNCELCVAQAEIERLHKVIDRAAKAWLSLEPQVAWEGDVADAMAAGVAEIERLNREVETACEDRANTYAKLAGAQAEIERLKALVEAAYTEGWNGRGLPRGIRGRLTDDWKRSEARAARNNTEAMKGGRKPSAQEVFAAFDSALALSATETWTGNQKHNSPEDRMERHKAWAKVAELRATLNTEERG